MCKHAPDSGRSPARAARVLTAVSLSLLLAGVVSAGPRAQQGEQAPLPAASSAASLLPIYGVDLELDQSWLDGSAFPSTSAAYPDQGASAALQALWQALSPSGINVLRVTVDVSDSHAAGVRLANLVAWAEANGATVIPTLVPGPPGAASGDAFAARAAETVRGALAALTQQGRVSAYSRVLLYQVGRDANHAGCNGGLVTDTAVAAARSAAAAVRQAETDALASSGLGLTPIMIQVSFDYELVKAGALAGVALTDDAYAQALGALRAFVAGVAAVPEVDELAVSWYPGSVSAGGPERFAPLLTTLVGDTAGKPLVFTTGCSTAFQPPEQQRQLVSVAFANLADLRASQGESSPVNGLLFHHALRPASAGDTPPADVAAALNAWNPAARAAELAQAWQGGTASAALLWWARRTEDGMGLLSLGGQAGAPTVTAQPGGDALAAIAAAIGEVVAEAVKGGETQGAEGGSLRGKVGEAVGGLATQVAGTVLDRLFQKLSESLNSALGTSAPSSGGYGGGSLGQAAAAGGGGAAGGEAGTGAASGAGTAGGTAGGGGMGVSGTSAGGAGAAAAPVVGIAAVALDPTTPQVGQPATVSVQLQNTGDGAASGLAIGVVDADGYLVGEDSLVEGVTVAAQATAPASVPWSPVQPEDQAASVKLYDSGWAELASAPITLTATAAAETPAPTATPAEGAGSTGTGVIGAGAGGLGVSGTGASGTGGGRGPLHVNPHIIARPKLLGPGFPHAGELQVSRMRTGEATVAMQVANTTPRSLPALTATLLLDGTPAATEDVGTILPGQTRTLSFRGVSFPGGKSSDVAVTLARRGAAPLVAGSASVDPAHLALVGAGLTVPAARTTTRMRPAVPPARVMSAQLQPTPTPVVAASAVAVLRPLTAPAARPAHTAAPGATPTPSLLAARAGTVGALGRPPTPQQPTPTPAAAAPHTAAALTARPAAAMPLAVPRPDPTLLQADLRVTPAAAAPGARITVTAVVRNAGTAAAESVRVAFTLTSAAGTVSAREEVVLGSVPARGSRPAVWAATLPAGGPWQVTAAVRAATDSEPTNNQASARIGVAAALTTARPR